MAKKSNSIEKVIDKTLEKLDFNQPKIIPNNTYIDGDEARILLQLIMSKDNSFNGNILDKVVKLRNRLWELHLNQPPKETGK